MPADEDQSLRDLIIEARSIGDAATALELATVQSLADQLQRWRRLVSVAISCIIVLIVVVGLLAFTAASNNQELHEIKKNGKNAQVLTTFVHNICADPHLQDVSVVCKGVTKP